MYDAAEKLYNDAIVKTTHSEHFYNKIGDLALKRKDLEKTAECYRKVLEANPINREVLVKIGYNFTNILP